MISRLEVLPGAGTVARFDEIAVWAGAGASTELLTFLVQSARNLGALPDGGQRIAAHLAGVLHQRNPEPNTPFVTVGPGFGAPVALLHGPVQMWDGGRWLRPEAATGWLVMEVPDVSTVLVTPNDTPAPPSANSVLDLLAGVVPGGGLAVVLSAAPVSTGEDAGGEVAGVVAASEVAGGVPAESLPAESAEAVPAESLPAESVEAVPAEAVPAEDEPAEDEPAEGEPAETEPTSPEPAASESEPAPTPQPSPEAEVVPETADEDPPAPTQTAASTATLAPAADAAPHPLRTDLPPVNVAPPPGSAGPLSPTAAPSAAPPADPLPPTAAPPADPLPPTAAPSAAPPADPLPPTAAPSAAPPADPLSPRAAPPADTPPTAAPQVAPPADPPPTAAPPTPGLHTVDLRTVPVESGTALPLGGPRESAAGGQMIDGVRCASGHFNHAGASACLRCGLPLDPAQGRGQGPRPGLGVLVGTDGSLWRADRGYLVGTAPSNDPAVASGELRALVVPDDGQVEGEHAELRVTGWTLSVIDRHTGSGTFILPAGGSDWERVPPEQPIDVRPGTHVAVGSTVFTFTSPWPL